MRQESYPERPDPAGDDWADHHADHLSRYLYGAPFVSGRRVLDAGTGPGYGAVLLKDAGASLWTATLPLRDLPRAEEIARSTPSQLCGGQPRLMALFA